MNCKVVNDFHIEFENERMWEKLNWLGVPLLTSPFDVFIIQDLIFKIKPDYIIETGTGYGGSSLFYAAIMQLIGKGEVLTVDIEKRETELDSIARRIKQQRVIDIEGSSVEPKVFNYINSVTKGKNNIVILDSWHSKDHVLKEMELYHTLVPVGSYLIIEDSHVNGHPVPWKWGEGPYEAITEFLRTHTNFMIDKECERLGFTFHPNGYLKRVR